jgi:ribosomal protein L11 methyltransferase
VGWQALVADVPRGLAERVSDLLFGLGSAGTEERFRPGEAPPPRQPWDTGPPPPAPQRLLVAGWFEDPDPDALVAALLRDLGDNASQVTTRWELAPDTDWEEAWKRSFPVLPVSPRLTIAPPWEKVGGAVIIEPGQGFGTGHHPTTLACLRQIDALADDARTLLDVGSGSGILAIAGARLGLDATGIDVDPVAVRDAEQNAARNGVTVAFSTTPVEQAAPADLVVANLHAEVLTKLADPIVAATKRWLVMAGILADREPLVRAAYGARLDLAHREQDGEWVCLRWRVRA